MAIRVRHGHADGVEWDAFVRAQPAWTHFHLYGWRRILERVHGHECLYLEARNENDELTAVLPLVRVRSRLFGHFLVSMPFLNCGGPLGSLDGVRALVAESVQLAQHDRVRLLELRSRTPLPTELVPSHRKITVFLDLPESPELLWKQLPAKVRSQVRRPQKEGVDVRVGFDQIEPFYDVFARHMRDLGTPVQSRDFFAAIAEEFPNEVRFACAYVDQRPIACGCGFMWQEEFEITWASALRSHKPLSANMLLYWTLMERAIGDGARSFNFGRCTPGSGTHRFKQQWGGRDEPLWWYQSSAEQGNVATPSPQDAHFVLATRIWSRLPVALTTRLGPSIVRYIP